MNNKLKKAITIWGVVGILLGCAGCSNNNTVGPDEEIAETGSFESMDITYPGKYKVTFMSQTTGHPSRDIDFSTDVGWKSEQIHGNCIIDYYVMSDNRIEDDYPEYDSLEAVNIDSKIYKVIREDEKVTLLYKVDDSFYIVVELHNMSQFDAEGNSTEEAYSISDLLDDGGFDNAIKMDIKEMEESSR